jgi:hypothetical protein
MVSFLEATMSIHEDDTDTVSYEPTYPCYEARFLSLGNMGFLAYNFLGNPGKQQRK